jgi:hypothetical protein
MSFGSKTLLAAGLLAAMGTGFGCSESHHKPESYNEQRPDPDRLVADDRGLQSKDVLAASDSMTMDLLSDPKLNASRTQWTLVVDHFDDLTRDKSFDTNYDIFLERLRTNLSEKSEGRITLLENRDKFNELRNRELDPVGGGPDKYGQGAPGGGGVPGSPNRIQPDYSLYGKAYDMPNRSTNYYLLEFTISDLHTGVQMWSRKYEVKVAH